MCDMYSSWLFNWFEDEFKNYWTIQFLFGWLNILGKKKLFPTSFQDWIMGVMSNNFLTFWIPQIRSLFWLDYSTFSVASYWNKWVTWLHLMVCYTQPSGKAPLEPVWESTGTLKKYLAGVWINHLSVIVHPNWLRPARSTNLMTAW